MRKQNVRRVDKSPQKKLFLEEFKTRNRQTDKHTHMHTYSKLFITKNDVTPMGLLENWGQPRLISWHDSSHGPFQMSVQLEVVRTRNKHSQFSVPRDGRGERGEWTTTTATISGSAFELGRRDRVQILHETLEIGHLGSQFLVAVRRRQSFILCAALHEGCVRRSPRRDYRHGTYV